MTSATFFSSSAAIGWRWCCGEATLRALQLLPEGKTTKPIAAQSRMVI
jgi:hypothetical protein